MIRYQVVPYLDRERLDVRTGQVSRRVLKKEYQPAKNTYNRITDISNEYSKETLEIVRDPALLKTIASFAER